MFHRIIMGMLTLLLIVTMGALGLQTLNIYEKSSVDVRKGFGTVTDKRYEPSRTILGGPPIPSIINHPEKWIIKVSIDSKNGEVIVSKSLWDDIHNSESVLVEYGYGKISSVLYIKSIEKLAAK